MLCTVQYQIRGELSLFHMKPGTSCLVIGEEGQNVLHIMTPRTSCTIVPFWSVEADQPLTSPRQVMQALQRILTDRLQALKDAAKELGLPYDCATIFIQANPSLKPLTSKQYSLDVVCGLALGMSPSADEFWFELTTYESLLDTFVPDFQLPRIE